MNYSEIWMDSLRGPDCRTLIYLRLLIRHMLQYSQVRNNMLISKEFLEYIKNYMSKRRLISEYKK